MTIRELKNILNSFNDDTKDVFIFDFEKNCDVDFFDISDNNGHAQININYANNEPLLFARYEMEKENINTDLLKKYLSSDNKNSQECILCFDSLQAAFKHCKIYNYDSFETFEQMINYYCEYMFLYKNKVYMILFENCLDIYQ